MPRVSRFVLVGLLMFILCGLRARFLTRDAGFAIDGNQKLRINFNITMPALSCEYASVDMLDLYDGSNKFVMTKDIAKWHTDANGLKREFHSRDKTPPDRRDLDPTYEDGDHAIELTEATFKEFVETNENVMVDFYAPWCRFSKKLAPTWEAFAKEMHRIFRGSRGSVTVAVAKVDCEAERNLCSSLQIRGYPTIRRFKSGLPDVAPDTQDRDVDSLVVDSLVHYATTKMEGNPRTPRRPERSENGEHVVQLTGANFTEFITSNTNVMVHFAAEYSGHCKKLIPTWEAFASSMEQNLDGKVKVAKVDCYSFAEERHEFFCMALKIQGYPEIRSYQSGVELKYNGGRSLPALVEHAAAMVGGGNVGCQLSGSILGNRMLGSFHVEARSTGVPGIDRAASNVSHVVHSLDFETHAPAIGQHGWVDTGVPLGELSAPGDRIHTIEVVLKPTLAGDMGAEESDNHRYEIVTSSQKIPPYLKEAVGAQFIYDLRAMSAYMKQKQRPRKWSGFLASVLSWRGRARRGVLGDTSGPGRRGGQAERRGREKIL